MCLDKTESLFLQEEIYTISRIMSMKNTQNSFTDFKHQMLYISQSSVAFHNKRMHNDCTKMADATHLKWWNVASTVREYIQIFLS